LKNSRNQKLVDFPVVEILSEQDALQWTFDDYAANIRKGAEFTHVFIALGSDVVNLSLAERLWAWEQALNQDNTTVVVPIIYQREAYNWVRLNMPHSSRLHPFCVDEAYSSEALSWRDSLEKMAERVNIAYGGAEQWPELNQEKRRSNLANARSLLTRFPRDGADCVAISDTVVDPINIERDAECEHRRWNAYVLMSGFSYANFAEQNNKIESVKLRDLARTNRNIVCYADLDDDIKEYDRQMVRQRHEILAAYRSNDV
jgi:hypothetical protein